MPEREQGLLLGLDIGTTHCKAGLFSADGKPVSLAKRAMPIQHAPEGWAFYDPEQTWQLVIDVMQEALSAHRDLGSGKQSLAAIGIASMAETGLLYDCRTGKPTSPLFPWFDQAAAPQADYLAHLGDPLQAFQVHGIPASFKCSLAKILWWRDRNSIDFDNAVWLPVASYIAFRLCGELAIDPTLAVRTWAYRLDTSDWDDALLSQFGLPRSLFPALVQSGMPVGMVRETSLDLPGVSQGVPVSICGHDHIVAAVAAGAIQPGTVFDSMGTAETLIGAFPERPLTESDGQSGLMFGDHVIPGQLIWLGSLSASGASVEWIRGLIGTPPISYQELAALLAGLPPEPGNILYYPYLSGSDSPHSDPAARGAFVGLSLAHTRADLIKAVLEGVALQMESIRQVTEAVSAQKIERIRAAGGGTRVPGWLQMKADISGCVYETLPVEEATLLGAALLAGIGAGVYASPEDALQAAGSGQVETFTPNPARHQAYVDLVARYCQLEPVVREFRT
jgi:xylulokinase